MLDAFNKIQPMPQPCSGFSLPAADNDFSVYLPILWHVPPPGSTGRGSPVLPGSKRPPRPLVATGGRFRATQDQAQGVSLGSLLAPQSGRENSFCWLGDMQITPMVSGQACKNQRCQSQFCTQQLPGPAFPFKTRPGRRLPDFQLNLAVCQAQ